ncbi:asparagine synthase (glutamine-hydrolyzing) [Alphaproteobacteria bacterium]|nr:asparagine synthase (glutamine-hydrolyzing) [Alphaproteobacteria bacterium]
MCGITGIFDTSGSQVSKKTLQKMNDTIKHRGPDGEGLYIEGPIGLGHRRLAIIDLTLSGHQPMSSHDGRYIVSYNGEIYNFKELRSELKTRGYIFKSSSDTEVLLASFSEWGIKSVNKFNGMFAFAIWDKYKQELILVRDRYGIKPLYFTKKGPILIFASEIKAILKSSIVNSHIDNEGLYEYLTFQNFFTNKTLFKGIETLSPGSFLSINLKGTMKKYSYWDFNYNEKINGTNEEIVTQCEKLFHDAVKLQLVSDVEVGSYLSGGIDSGGITAFASKYIKNLKTFTIGFDMQSASGIEMTYDERSRAEYMSYLFNTEHYQMVLKAGDMEKAMADLVYHLEEPRVGQSYPNYYAAKLASKFGKVVLSGIGGDEIFGGYPWRYYKTGDSLIFKDFISKYYGFWQRLIPNNLLQKTLSPIWSDVKHVDTIDIFESVFKDKSQEYLKPEDFVNKCLYLESKTFLHGVLTVEDKLSMAHSLESRVPFLENNLVDFASKIPVNSKISNLTEITMFDENIIGRKDQINFEKTRDGKLILREILKKHVPEKVYNGLKQGFSAPDASWFRGESIEFVKDTLFNKKAKIYNVLDQKTITGLIEQHLNGSENRRLLVWSLLYLETFMNEFIN